MWRSWCECTYERLCKQTLRDGFLEESSIFPAISPDVSFINDRSSEAESSFANIIMIFRKCDCKCWQVLQGSFRITSVIIFDAEGWFTTYKNFDPVSVVEAACVSHLITEMILVRFLFRSWLACFHSQKYFFPTSIGAQINVFIFTCTNQT